jgi:hypothetical protein
LNGYLTFEGKIIYNNVDAVFNDIAKLEEE